MRGINSCDVLGISSFNPIAYLQTTDYISEKVGELSLRAPGSVVEHRLHFSCVCD